MITPITAKLRKLAYVIALLALAIIAIGHNLSAEAEAPPRTELLRRLTERHPAVPAAILTFMSNTCPDIIAGNATKWESLPFEGQAITCVRTNPLGKGDDGVYCCLISGWWKSGTIGFYEVRGKNCRLLWEKIYPTPLAAHALDTVRLGLEPPGCVSVSCRPDGGPPPHEIVVLTCDGQEVRELFHENQAGAKIEFDDTNADSILELVYLAPMYGGSFLAEQVHVYDADSAGYRLNPLLKTHKYEYDMRNPGSLAGRIRAVGSRPELQDSSMLVGFIRGMPPRIASYLYQQAGQYSAATPPYGWLDCLTLDSDSTGRVVFCAASDDRSTSYLKILQQTGGQWRWDWDTTLFGPVPYVIVDTVRLGIESDEHPTILVRGRVAAWNESDIIPIDCAGRRGRLLLSEPVNALNYRFEDLDGGGIKELLTLDGGLGWLNGTWTDGLLVYDPRDRLYHAVSGPAADSSAGR